MATALLTKLMSFLGDKEKQIVQAVSGLTVDDKLALLYYIYEQMGDSITPAAPTAADPELTPTLLGDFYNLSKDDQLNVMREIVSQQDTPYSRYYGALTENNRLVVWYAWAKDMGGRVVDMPDSYKPQSDLQPILKHIESLDFQDQISVLRAIAADMGYSDVAPIPTQSETGKTSSL